jgi:GxxExxY protein
VTETYAALPEATTAIGRSIFDAALTVHKALGPGLLESVYEICLARELELRGHFVTRQVELPVLFKDIRLEAGYRIDLIVDDAVIIEVKSVETLAAVHEAQLLTYMKLSGVRLGYLINFNVPLLKNGVRRRIV